MMDGGDEYIHFHIARRDREVLASMMEGLTVRGKTIRIEDLIPAVEAGRKSLRCTTADRSLAEKMSCTG